MHLDNLKIFSDLVEGESFSQAARINGVTQSAVSQQLRALEKEVGFNLVDRSQKQFRLTREGRKFHGFADEVLKRYRDLQNELMGMQQVLGGFVSVSTIYSIGLYEIPGYMKRFLQQYPAVDVHLQYRRSSQVYDDVLKQGVDMGLVAFPEKHRGLEVILFREDPMVLVAAPGHVLAGQRVVSLKDLAGLPFVGFVPGLPTRSATDELFSRAEVKVKMGMEFDNIETVKSAVEIGTGFALLPAGTVKHEIEKGTLIVLPLIEPTFHRPLAVVHRKDRPLSPAALQLLAVLVKG